MDFKQRKLEKVLRKGNIYLEKLNLSKEEKITRLLKGFPVLKDEMAIKEDDKRKEVMKLEAANIILKDSRSRFLEIITTNNESLRKQGDKWDTEMVTLFLLKAFKAYDFDKLKYIMKDKLVIEKQFLIPQLGITDKVNLFINETLKTDKYNILSLGLISRKQLLRWKYRSLIKESEREKINLDSLNKEDREIIINLFYK